MRARITSDQWNQVTITNDGRQTTYFVPYSGGYVRIRDATGRNSQVCKLLYTQGPTLQASPETLLAVIRREWRRRQRRLAAEQQARW